MANGSFPPAAALFSVAAVPSGPLRLPLPPPLVEIVDNATGAVVATAPLLLRAANSYLSGEDVWAFNFSLVRGPGIYSARVAGVGSSVLFPVAPAALDFGAYTAARALYYQRYNAICGYFAC